MKKTIRSEVERVVGDLHIVVENHSDVLRNNALPFRILVALRTIGLFVSVFHAPFSFLSLTPIQLFSIEIWRLVTCAFVGKNLLLFAWTIFSLHIGTNLVRQASSNETLLKIFAITQFLPDTILLATPFGRVKYTHLPFTGFVLSGVAALLKLVEPIVFIQVLVGIQVSWTYLRFIHPHESDAIYGDSSELFTWASLFPRAIQPVCTILGRICFRTLVKLNVCKRQVRHVDLNSLQTVPINLPALDSTAKDAERRRQKALRDLNERLSKTKKVETITWDEDEKEVQKEEKSMEQPEKEMTAVQMEEETSEV